jgi:hypothetical protein
LNGFEKLKRSHEIGSHASVGSLLLLGIVQVLRGVLNSLLNYRSYHLGPLTPPGVDVDVTWNPIFLYLYIIDIVLIVMIPLLRKNRVAFFVLFSLDIQLALEAVWYRIAVHRPYDWLLMSYGIGVSILSIIHLALLLAWDLLIMKESHTS